MSKDPYNTADMKKEWEYTETEDGGIRLLLYKGSAADVFIPQRIGKKTVEQIHMLSGNNITTIHIPKSVISIDKGAFAGCINLSSFNIDPENEIYSYEGNCLIENGDTVIWGNKDSVIPDDGRISKIGELAFSNCAGLTSIKIPNSVTHIASEAFCYCKDLVEVVLSENLIWIGKRAFERSEQVHFNYHNGMNYLGSDSNPYLVLCSAAIEDITSCEIHPDARVIMPYALAYCRMLTSITIPASTVSIGVHGFPPVENLNIIIDPQNEHYTYSGHCLIENGDTVIWGRRDSIIPSTNCIKKIGECAFEGRKNLNKIAIPHGVIEIAEEAFSRCESLVSVDLPDGIECIGTGAFKDCEKLNTINLPDAISVIGEKAFENCRHLTLTKLPKMLNKISHGTFTECRALQDITIPQNSMIIEELAFSECKNLRTVFVPENVQCIQEGAFRGCTSLRSVTICNPEMKIANTAFHKINDTVFYGPKGSTTEQYAVRKKARFVEGYGPKESIAEEYAVQKKTSNSTCSKSGKKPTFHAGEYIVRYRFLNNMSFKWSVWKYCEKVFTSVDDAMDYGVSYINLPDSCFEGEAEILDYYGKAVAFSSIS